MRTTEALKIRARTQPYRTIFRLNGVDLTYRDWLERSLRVAEALVCQGVQRGDRLAIAYRPVHWFDYASSWLGCQLAGAIPVGIPEHLAESAIRRIVADSGAHSIVGDRDVIPGMRHLSVERSSPAPGFVDKVQGTDDEIAELVATSGTTGANKLVACPHGNLMADAIAVDAGTVFGSRIVEHLSRPVMGTNAAQRAIINALRGTWYCFNILSTIESREVMDILRSQPIDEVSFVPVTAAALVRERQHGEFPAVRVVRMGTAATPEWVVRGLRHIFPNAELVNNYGLTEGGHFRLSGTFHEGRRGSLRAVDDGQVRVVKDDGDDAAEGELGVLWVQADPQFPRSYYREGMLSPIADRRGWIRTHDIAEVVGPGAIVLIGRSDETANVGGIKVSLPMVEEVVGEICGVRDCAAFTLPHRTLGELLGVAIVVDREADEDVEAAKFGINRSLGSSAPRLWLRVEKIPRTVIGKVRRAVLTELARGHYGC